MRRRRVATACERWRKRTNFSSPQFLEDGRFANGSEETVPRERFVGAQAKIECVGWEFGKRVFLGGLKSLFPSLARLFVSFEHLVGFQARFLVVPHRVGNFDKFEPELAPALNAAECLEVQEREDAQDEVVRELLDEWCLVAHRVLFFSPGFEFAEHASFLSRLPNGGRNHAISPACFLATHLSCREHTRGSLSCRSQREERTDAHKRVALLGKEHHFFFGGSLPP